MEKTLKLMKSSGLFDSLVDNMVHHDMDQEAVDVALCAVMDIDPDFEDTFLNDVHQMAVDAIWKELCAGASEMEKMEALNKVDPKNLMDIAMGKNPKGKDEEIVKLLTKVIDLLSAE